MLNAAKRLLGNVGLYVLFQKAVGADRLFDTAPGRPGDEAR